MNFSSVKITFGMLLATSLFAQEAVPERTAEVRIKDLVNIRGVRSNQLIGMGLVVGLNKSGDSGKNLMTNRSASEMLRKIGLPIKENEVMSGSVAAVLVTAELPTFSRGGDRIDVRVSTVGDAKSLLGGTLISTPLKAGDGRIYAVAQGALVIGQGSATVSQVQTTARIPLGAIVEREFEVAIDQGGLVQLSLKQADFTTNIRIVDAINEKLKGFFAKSVDPGTITLKVPLGYQDRVVTLLSEIESLPVKAQTKAIVVVQERTGTIVMGGDTVIDQVSITHGDLSISVGGSKKDAKEKQALVNLSSATVGGLVQSLNRMGVKPADLAAILQALSQAGALHGELRFL